MPRVARSASEQFAILEGVCRGHVAKHSVSAIAVQVGVSRATVRARVKQFVHDGRGLVEFLDAFRPPDIIDHKLERRRQHARERQRDWQRRANGTAPAPTTFKRTGRPRKRVPEDVLDRLECMRVVGRPSDQAHITKVMQRFATEWTSGAHTSWTTAAVLGAWRPLDTVQELTFNTLGLTLADVVPALLAEWGWSEDGDGVWVNPRAPLRHADHASSDDGFGLTPP